MKLDPRRIIRHDHSDNNNGGRLAANASGSVAGGGTTTVAATRLRDLTDVDLVTTAPADNDALTYDLAADRWVPGSATGALDDLTDVTITSPAVADRLRYDGSQWVNSALIWKPVLALDPGSGLYVNVHSGGDPVMAEG